MSSSLLPGPHVALTRSSSSVPVRELKTRALRSLENIAAKYPNMAWWIQLYNWDDRKALEDFLRMEKWIFDSPDQAGEAFREFIKQFYQGNGFVNGGVSIGGREVDLGFVDMPVLNIYAEQDHLVPPSASQPLQRLVAASDYSTHEFQGGHIGIYVSGTAQRQIPDRIAGWLRERE